MTVGQRVGVIIGAAGVLLAVVLLLLPFTARERSTSSTLSQHCSSTFTYWHRSDFPRSAYITAFGKASADNPAADADSARSTNCYARARDRGPVFVAIGGSAILIGALVFFLFRRGEDPLAT